MSRQHFFIKPKIQLRYLLRTVGTVIITAAVLYIFLRNEIGASLKVLLDAEVFGRFVWILTKTFFIVTLIIVIMFCLNGLFSTHSLAGAIYALERMFKNIAEGNFRAAVEMRKGDELKDTVVQVQGMIGKLRGLVYDDRVRAEDSKIMLDEVLADLNANKPKGEIINKLNAVKVKLSAITSGYKI